ncbi:MAG: hypothetical protein J2P28_18135, partial [Actinobacteria bacterium]|nr:hypothetical protein [Actinomycetota bacterium]
AADLTARKLSKWRAAGGSVPGDVVSAIAFYYPWAIVRSVLRFVFLAPIALLCAGVAAMLALSAGGLSELPRAVSYAAGALVACYCLGPGSAACRRPLGRFYARVGGSAPVGTISAVGMAVIAIAVASMALTRAPGYWPDVHLGDQLHSVAAGHPAFSNVSGVGGRFWRWLAYQIP